MGFFQYQGKVQTNFTNTPLGVASFHVEGNSVFLASEIKNGAIKLTLNAGQVATSNFAYSINSNTETITVPWGEDFKEFSVPDINRVLNSTGQSSLSVYEGGSGAASDRFEAISFELDGQAYLALAETSGAGIATFAVSQNGTVSPITMMDDADGAFTDSPSSLALTDFGNTKVLVSVSASDDSISSFKIEPSGEISLVETIGVVDFLPVGTPQDVATVSNAGREFVVMASSDTSSLTVFELNRNGNLTAVDQVVDDLSTRMQGANVIETFTIEDRAFVLAAGQDSGVSLFGLMPDGQLLHLDTIADQLDTPIDTITDMQVVDVDGEFQLFTISGSETGIGQYTLDLDELGLTASVDSDNVQGTNGDDLLILDDAGRAVDGGAGRDILKDGGGQDTLIGGSGTDIFIVADDGVLDTVADFNPSQDQLDLSNLPFFRSVSQLDITSTQNGADIRFGDEVIRVISSNGQSLSADDFTDENTINATHVDTSFVFDDFNSSPMTLEELKSSFTVTGTSQSASAIEGASADDVLIGSAAAQRIEGGSGHDILRGGDGADQLIGGDGLDLADYANADAAVTANLSDPSQNAGDAQGDTYSSIEGITGSTHSDTLGGDDDANAFFGEDGNDVVRAQAGDDYVYGGRGDDWLDGGLGDDSVRGGGGNDAMLGRDGNDALYGAAGDDNIAAHAGNDSVYGGAGNDQLGGSTGDDIMFGGSGDDVIGSGSDDDFINAGLGDDVASGGWGRDQVLGGDGNDTLAGSYGDDTVMGGAGNDALGGGTGTDQMYAGDGNDTIGAGDDDDFAYGGAGDDFIGGGSGHDTLFGGDGDDRINSGDGNDTMEGGAGNDTYVFNTFIDGEIDTIRDWNATEDIIRMKSVQDRFNGLEISTVQIDGTQFTEISYDGHRIRLADTDASTITADDFIFIG